MDTTPRHGFALVAAQQASKHTAVNSSLQALDVLVQATAISAVLTAPPPSPAEGDSYIVADSATGDWTGKDGTFAVYLDAHWTFRVPDHGWLVYVVASDEVMVCRSGGWEPFASNGGTTIASFGINTAADATNRLTSASHGTLLSHDGDDHRLTINKAGSGDTASIVYQAGFSGRAETGLAGDDHWRLKVSPDGSGWNDALTADNATGALTAAGGITAPAHRLDANGYLELSSNQVRLNFDSGDSLHFDRSSNGLVATIGSASRYTWSSAAFRPSSDNSVSVGQSGFRFSSVWAVTGTIQTSDEASKTDIAPSDLGLDFVRALQPVSFRWKVGANEVIDGTLVPRPGRRRHYGLVAQQVKAVLDDLGAGDFGGYIKTDLSDPASETGLRYDQFIAPLIRAVQQIADRLEQLDARLAGKPASA